MSNMKKPKVLLVDDEKPILDALYRFSRQRKLDAHRANSGLEGLALMDEHEFDVIISDMRMPNMDGAEFLTKARAKSPSTIRILLTGYADMEAVISAVNEAKIFNYLHKPWDDNLLSNVIESALAYQKSENERLRMADEIAEKNHQLEELNSSLEEKVEERTQELHNALSNIQQSNKKISNNFREALTLLTSLIEMQDTGRIDQANMISNTCVSIAKSLELPAKNIEQIRIASLLHNIGKLSLPETIRKKPVNQLTTMEKDNFQTHPIQGEAVLSGMTGLKNVAKIIRSHREYLNGSGFPDKSKGDNIPMGSKIICLVSDFESLERGMLLKEISGPEEAIDYIKSMSGKLYDARIVDLFDDYYQKHLQNYRSYLSRLSLKEVKVDMVLASNLVSDTGLLLLTKGTKLKQEHLDHLLGYEAEVGGKLVFPILNESIDQLMEEANLNKSKEAS